MNKKNIRLAGLLALTASTAGVLVISMHVKGVVPNLIVWLTIALQLLGMGIMFYNLSKIATEPQTNDEVDEVWQIVKRKGDDNSQELRECIERNKLKKMKAGCEERYQQWPPAKTDSL